MKTTRPFILTAALFAAVSSSRAQSFDAGDLVLFRVGNGGSTLTSAGTAISLDQYTTGGTFVSGVSIPSTGTGQLVSSGTASSEGGLTLSADGRSLIFGGYNVAAGTTGIASATSATVPRALGTVGANGIYSLAATTSSFYSGNNIRGGTSDGHGNFWGAGAAATGGTVYLGTGTPAQVSAVNSIVVKDISGNLFYSTAKGTTGIYEISGTPTAGPVTPTLLIANATPSDFSFNANMTIAYVASTTLGIQRYDFNGTAWALTYTLDSGTGMNGLAVDYSSGTANIFATTEDGKTYGEITDTGAGATFNPLATVDGTTEAFRGIEFAPTVPEPSTYALIGLGAAAFGAVRRPRKS